MILPTDELKMIIGMKEDIASIKSILGTMANTNSMALEALKSASSAHKRIDELNDELNDRLKEIKAGQRWMIGSAISMAGLFIAAVSMLWKLAG